MHSSFLRGSDFTILQNGTPCEHAHFFGGLSNSQRLGLVVPNGIEGVGAMNLVMAYVTAFYDTYRAVSEQFFSYPDYFTFQSCQPLASYSMCDIWPEHKNVYVADDPSTRLDAINDRGINILILPDRTPTETAYHAAQLESARRNIDTCYAYVLTGHAADADLTIRCREPSLFQWAQSVIESAGDGQAPCLREQLADWETKQAAGSDLDQSFRTLTLDEALNLL